MSLHGLRTLVLTVISLGILTLAQNSSWEAKNRAGEKAFQEGKLADADELFTAALKDAQQFGPKDLRLAPILNNLALVAFVRNDFVRAQENFEQAISVIEGARGPEDALLLPILDNLTRLYIKQWAFDNAIQTSWRACHIREKKLGVEHPDTATNLNQLATLYFDSVRLLPHEQSALPQPTDQAGNPENSARSLFEGDDVQDDAAKLSMAESLYQKVLAAQEKHFGADSVRLVNVLESLASVSQADGNFAQAEQSHARAISLIEKSFGPDDPKLVEPLHQMAELKTQDGSYSEAEKLYQRALHIDEQRLGPKDASLGPLLVGYAALSEKMHRPDQANDLTKRAASLPKPRTPAAVPVHQNAAPAPYVLRFERAVSDRYSGVRQTCLLVQTDGRFRIEEQLHDSNSGSLIVPTPRMPDGGMPDSGAPQERLDDRAGTGPRSAKVFEDSVDPDTLQQLKAILSAKDLRDIRGVYPPRGRVDYYGTEKIAVYVPRDDGVQTFAFPDSYTRQPFDNALKPLFKWLSTTEKHKGSQVKAATATNCSPDFGQPATVPSISQAQKPAANSLAKTEPALDKTRAASSSAPDLPTIKVAVNLVPVRVVVRDSQGRAIGNLRQEDFQILDNHQPQIITRFLLEQSGDQPGTAQKVSTGISQGTPAENGKSAASAAERYVAYLFDDVHFTAAELAQVRDAANRHLAGMPPADRAGVFTTSAQTTVDFTNDVVKLQEALLHITPHPLASAGGKDCPDIDPYMAYLIWSKNDEDALAVATEDALVCAFGSDARRAGRAAEVMARSTAQQQVAASDLQAQAVLRAFRNILLKLVALPGQHTIVLLSPGFVSPGREQDFTQLIDRALRANVIISTLDARGLFNVDSSVADARPGVDIAVTKIQYRRESAAASTDVLASLAEGTGGNFFHNSNDMDEGFKRTVAPEYSYLLGFSPADLKPDGSFHQLNVTLKSLEKLTVQARKGYYAPKPASSRPAELPPKPTGN